MPKKRSDATPTSLDLFFAKELADEESPSFAAMMRPYEQASDLFGFHPWQILDESELVVTHDSQSGEPWYCSVMGAMGEVHSMQAYRGEEGLRLFHSIAAEYLTAHGKVLASMHRTKSTARLCWRTRIIGLASAASQHRRVAFSIYHARGFLE